MKIKSSPFTFSVGSSWTEICSVSLLNRQQMSAASSLLGLNEGAIHRTQNTLAFFVEDFLAKWWFEVAISNLHGTSFSAAYKSCILVAKSHPCNPNFRQCSCLEVANASAQTRISRVFSSGTKLRDWIFLEIVDGFSRSRYSFKIFPGLKVTVKTFLPRRPHIEPLRRKDPGHSSARVKNLRNEIANWCKLPPESHHWNHEIGCVEQKYWQMMWLGYLLNLSSIGDYILSWLVTNKSGHGLPTNPEPSCN